MDNEKDLNTVNPEMQNMYNPNAIQYANNEAKKNPVIYIILLVCLALCMGACFLPYASIEGFTFNYVYSEEAASLSGNSGLKDGLFILIFCGISIITLLIKKRRIPPLVCTILSYAVFMYDYINDNSSIQVIRVSDYYSVGFYLVLVFLTISLVLSIVRMVLKNKLT